MIQHPVHGIGFKWYCPGDPAPRRNPSLDPPGQQLPDLASLVIRHADDFPFAADQVMIGIHAYRFVRDPDEVVKVNQRVTVTVLEVDIDRKRISLSMKSGPKPQPAND